MGHNFGLMASIFGSIMAFSLIAISLADITFLENSVAIITYLFAYIISLFFAIAALKSGEETLRPILCFHNHQHLFQRK